MTIEIPYDYIANICEHRLPCGICRITMKRCLKDRVEHNPITTFSTGTSGRVTYADHTKVKLDKE